MIADKEYCTNIGNFLCQELFSVNGKNAYYILNCALNSCSNAVAIVLSNNVITVMPNTTQNYIPAILEGHQKRVTGIKFSSIEPSLLFSCSLDGKLMAWDTRSTKIVPVQTFVEDSNNDLKPLTCFDFNADERLLCAGTELIREDAFLVFWDRRTSKSLGGYWNCHTDEITQVHFHPSQRATMASSSVDGLINVYNLDSNSEDEALTYTLNVRSSVNSFKWVSEDHISCISGIEEYQKWPITEACPTITVSRQDLSNNFQWNVDYMIDTVMINDASYLATGTYKGDVHLWQIEEKNLTPSHLLTKGHSDVVRTICFQPIDNAILTGGEDGVMYKWQQSQ